MEDRTIPAAPSDMNEKYEKAIREKLDALLRTNHYSQTQFCQILKDRGLALEQGNLSSMLKGRKHIPLSLIVHVCNIFHISLEELVDENFGGANQAGAEGYVPQLYSDDLLLQLPYLGEAFVTDPCSQAFRGYLQTYYVYMNPGNGEDTKLVTGTLTLEANGSVCEATLQLNSNKVKDGKTVYRVYKGRAIISKTVDAVYVLLTSSIEGHMCIISFRYLYLPHQTLDCRIAAVLTNSAGEYHSPTLNRLLLSRTKFAPEHLDMLTPNLLFNSNEISIPKSHLDVFRAEHPEYAELFEHLTRFEPTETYYWNEDYVLGVARRFLSKSQRLLFLSNIRALSTKDSLNKTSRRADILFRDLLLSLGYYKDHDL